MICNKTCVILYLKFLYCTKQSQGYGSVAPTLPKCKNYVETLWERCHNPL